MSRQAYPSDLTDAQWAHLAPLVPTPKPGGRPATVPRREIVHAIRYVVRNGIVWRALPHDFPTWETVAYYCYRWSEDGSWDRLHAALREDVRVAAGREPSPSLAILDAQRVPTTETATADERGYDAGKKVKGRKRHLAVAILGLLLGVVVTTANVQDRTGARRLAGQLRGRFPRLVTLLGDGGYRSGALSALLAGFGWLLEIVRGASGHGGFEVIPKRWIVERTFGGLNRYRRLSKDYERLPETSAVMIRIAMSHLMLRRLHR